MEEELLKDKEAKAPLSEEILLKQRKEKLLSAFKKDKYFAVFSSLSVLSLLFFLLTKLGFSYYINIFTPAIWLILAICSALSAFLVFYKKESLSFYPLLAFLVFLAVRIRTLNLSGLKDITTGGYTLGPDLDPFLFLRVAKDILAHGSIPVIDMMRYVPLGFKNTYELYFLSYLIAWFHKIAVLFGSTSIEQSAVLFPAVFFGLTVIAFFFMTRKIFLDSLGYKLSNIIALIASFFLTVMPPLLPRTIAGIPEKESVGFFFMFLTFYLFLSSWKAKKDANKYILAALTGLSIAGMALVWGGFVYLFVIIALVAFISFLLGKIDVRKIISYSITLITASIIMSIFSARYDLYGVATSSTTGAAFVVLILIIADQVFYRTKIRKYLESNKLKKIPRPVLSFLIVAILGTLVILLTLGPGFLYGQVGDVIHNFVRPVTDRLGVTVAENRQPYFNEWAGNFGPFIKNIPLTFWLFFAGSIYLYYFMMSLFTKKERFVLTASYLIFLLTLIFSRYDQNSILNGASGSSLLVYFSGFIILVGSFGYYYYQYHKRGEQEKLKDIDTGLILLFSFFFLSIVSARGAVRLIMVLVPTASIIIAYFLISLIKDSTKQKGDLTKIIYWGVAVLVLLAVLFSAYNSYQVTSSQSVSYVPSIYTQQWQKAMAWVRESTPVNSVFGHWWDYGYWVQSIGERATVLDGGNAISYWNHLMGRYALTGTDEAQALEFLYAHNTTHFLIDSTDIGKYSAFSSIGSDENYDRASYFPIFQKNTQSTKETKNSTILFYQGGSYLDEDLLYDINGTKLFLPSGKAGIGAVLVEKNKSGAIISQPIGVFVYQNQQYNLPLRYIYDGKLIDFGSGVEAGIFLFPLVNPMQNGIQIDKDGAMLYLTKRTVNSQLARLYLFNENDPYFKLVHSEDDFVVAQLKAQNPSYNSDFAYYQGFRGPIRIWEIKYPSNIKFNEAYIKKDFPDKKLTIAQ